MQIIAIVSAHDVDATKLVDIYARGVADTDLTDRGVDQQIITDSDLDILGAVRALIAMVENATDLENVYNDNTGQVFSLAEIKRVFC